MKSSDFGSSWRSITDGLPDDEPIRAFAEDPEAPDLLFLGTEFGVYATLNGGGTWVSLQNDLPTVPMRIPKHGSSRWLSSSLTMPQPVKT